MHSIPCCDVFGKPLFVVTAVETGEYHFKALAFSKQCRATSLHSMTYAGPEWTSNQWSSLQSTKTATARIKLFLVGSSTFHLLLPILSSLVSVVQFGKCITDFVQALFGVYVLGVRRYHVPPLNRLGLSGSVEALSSL